MSNLVKYDAMCRAIDAAYDVDEVKDIRDKALAFEAYAQQAKNTEAERRACEIRLRAERKAGQILVNMDKHRGAIVRDDSEPEPQKLSDLGISLDQSSKWQKLAGVPDEQFEASLAGPDKPSTAGVLRQNGKTHPMDDDALWLWGRLRDFERKGLLDMRPQDLLDEMTDAMKADTIRLAPLVSDWLATGEK